MLDLIDPLSLSGGGPGSLRIVVDGTIGRPERIVLMEQRQLPHRTLEREWLTLRVDRHGLERGARRMVSIAHRLADYDHRGAEFRLRKVGTFRSRWVVDLNHPSSDSRLTWNVVATGIDGLDDFDRQLQQARHRVPTHAPYVQLQRYLADIGHETRREIEVETVIASAIEMDTEEMIAVLEQRGLLR